MTEKTFKGWGRKTDKWTFSVEGKKRRNKWRGRETTYIKMKSRIEIDCEKENKIKEWNCVENWRVETGARAFKEVGGGGNRVNNLVYPLTSHHTSSIGFINGGCHYSILGSDK